MHGVHAIFPSWALFSLLQTDSLIVGGGGLFSSDVGPFGRWIPLFCKFAWATGAQVRFHGVGVYPSTPRRVLNGLRRIAPRLEAFTVRDSESLEALSHGGIQATLIPDLSESMTAAPAELGRVALVRLGLDLRRPIVGLCLTAINEALAEDLHYAVPRLIDQLPEVQFCFIPMSQHPTNSRHNDRLFGETLQKVSPRLKVLSEFCHPSIMLSIFGELSAAVCVRYHSFLFSHRAGIPIIGVPYAEKCHGWLRESGVSPVPPTAKALIESLELALQTPSRIAAA
jgi:polysaccharide pyruvyl transferase WcaK-like protein